METETHPQDKSHFKKSISKVLKYTFIPTHPLSSAVYFSAPKYKLVGKEKMWSTVQCQPYTTPEPRWLYRGAQLITRHHCRSSSPTRHHQRSLVTKSPTTKASFQQNRTLC